jgi:ribonuclease HI
MQLTAQPMVIHSAHQLGRLLHTNLHKNGNGCKTLKGNQIIALTQKKDKRIFRSEESHISQRRREVGHPNLGHANLGHTNLGHRELGTRETMAELVAYIDGGCLGNPGPSGIGVVINGIGGGPVRISKWIGRQDNNVAEYAALMEALQYAVAQKARKLHVFSDSEVVVRQMTGEYKCRSPRLYSLHWTCRKLARSLKFSISHVPRENNAEANRLAQSALKGRG